MTVYEIHFPFRSFPLYFTFLLFFSFCSFSYLDYLNRATTEVDMNLKELHSGDLTTCCRETWDGSLKGWESGTSLEFYALCDFIRRFVVARL